MRRALTLAALLGVAMTTTAGQAYVDPSTGREYVEKKVWFHSALTPVGTADYIIGENEPTLGGPIGWDTTAPTASIHSVTLGNNYSTFMDLVEPGWRERQTFTARGSFTGDINTIAVDLFFTGPLASLCGMGLAWDVRVDDAEILYTDQTSPSADLKVESLGRGIYKVRFILTKINRMMNLWGLPSGPSVEHDVYLNFANFYACQEAVWLYDKAETPSSMIFNMDPTSTEAAKYTTVDVTSPPPPLPAG